MKKATRSEKQSRPRKANYTTTRAIIAAPWLALRSVVVLTLALSVGGVQ